MPDLLHCPAIITSSYTFSSFQSLVHICSLLTYVSLMYTFRCSLVFPRFHDSSVLFFYSIELAHLRGLRACFLTCSGVRFLQIFWNSCKRQHFTMCHHSCASKTWQDTKFENKACKNYSQGPCIQNIGFFGTLESFSNGF